MEAMERMIEDVNPDVICFQEKVPLRMDLIGS